MAQFNNLMEIYKLLDKSNCKKCNQPTCMAFAAAVFKGQKKLSDCPMLDSETVQRHQGQSANINPLEQATNEFGEKLKSQIRAIDPAEAARRLDIPYENGRVTIRCLGKNVHVDAQGRIITDIHIHDWLTIPMLDYVIKASDKPIAGQWVPFRELPGGKSWQPLFGQTCEKRLKKVADEYTGLFADMLELFNGRQVKELFESDISLVLHPLPKVPILICYWKPEDGLESDLNLFFDSTAEDQLSIESLYTLGVGLTTMFEKITLRNRR